MAIRVVGVVAVRQADLVQASGKGALRGAEDSRCNGAHGRTEHAKHSCAECGAISIQDVELCELFVNLGIIPGKPVPQVAVEATQA